MFGLSAWFSGPSEPENGGKQNECDLLSHRVAACLRTALAMLTVLPGLGSRAYCSHLIQEVGKLKKGILVNTSRIFIHKMLPVLS